MTNSELMVIGATASKEPVVVPRKLKGVYTPKVETSVHKSMFEYYRALGKIRSIPRVARHFGKSVPFISTLSRAFNWQERLYQSVREDPVVGETSAGMDATRTKIAHFVNDIADTLSELSALSKKVRRSVNGVTEEDGKEARTLLEALKIFGISINKPKDLRDLISVLKDIQDFKAEAALPPAATKITQNIDKAVIIKGID